MATVTEMHLGGSRGGEGRYRFNYKGMHRYLISMPTRRSVALFTAADRVLKVLQALRDAEMRYHFDIYAYCFLPDRLVMIIRGKTEEADMKAFAAAFRALAQELLQTGGTPLWERKYTERVLRKGEDTRAIAQEVFSLVVKAGLATAPDQYPFLGSFVMSYPPRPPAGLPAGSRAAGRSTRTRPPGRSTRGPRRA